MSSTSDRELARLHERYYLDLLPHLWRWKELVSSIPILCENEKLRILEIGSGIGTNCILIKAITDGEVTGLEPAPASFHNLKECISSFQECNRNFPYSYVNCGGEDIPSCDNYYDFVFSFEVMEHVQNPQKVFEEIHRVLKPGGYAYISTCNYDSFYEGHYKRFWNPFIGVEGNRKNYVSKGLSPDFLDELNFITKKKIIKWVKKIGFSDVKFSPSSSSSETISLDNIVAVYPDNYSLPDIMGRSVFLHRFIEKPMVNRLLTVFDREYKLYILLKK